ncbi:MAG: ABC transporter permease [Gemmatimonadota bacterium]
MRVQVRREDDVLVLALAGDWELPHAPPRFGPLLERPEPTPVRAVDFDVTALGRWDSSILTFLRQAEGYCIEHDVELREENLPPAVTRLLALARAVPEQEIDRTVEETSFVSRLGMRGVATLDAVTAGVSFAGEVAEGFGRVVRFRVRLRWRDFWTVVQSNSSGALPIVTLIAFLVGVIIAFLGAVVLRRFGADYYVSYLVGYGMLREMAALMTGIIMAGRTGAGFAAELGSMKITEEIDAFRTLGISPIDHLVLPRVLGLFVTMPLLTLYASFVGIMGGLLVSISMLDVTSTQFVVGMLSAVTLSDGLLGLFKGTVFGLIIGLAGCMKGLQAGSDAGAVGRAATAAVVLGITLIIGANALIDWLAVLLNV